MLTKLLKTHKPEQHSSHNNATLPSPSPGPIHDNTAALQIIHVGGIHEYYYMAVPAKRIMDKYPLFHLTRPEFFQQPWQSLVKPDQILLPGQRFFVVPRHTVRKLRRRANRPTILPELVPNRPIDRGGQKHVRFIGFEERPNRSPLSVEKKVNGQLGTDVKTMLRRSSMWEPSLASIEEKHGPNE